MDRSAASPSGRPERAGLVASSGAASPFIEGIDDEDTTRFSSTQASPMSVAGSTFALIAASLSRSARTCPFQQITSFSLSLHLATVHRSISGRRSRRRACGQPASTNTTSSCDPPMTHPLSSHENVSKSDDADEELRPPRSRSDIRPAVLPSSGVSDTTASSQRFGQSLTEMNHRAMACSRRRFERTAARRSTSR